MKLKDFIIGLAATLMGIIAFGLMVRFVWKAWDTLIQWLVQKGYSPNIEYLLGFIIFILAVYLGVVQLKKIGK